MNNDDIVQIEMDNDENEFKTCCSYISWFFIFLFILLIIFKALE